METLEARLQPPRRHIGSREAPLLSSRRPLEDREVHLHRPQRPFRAPEARLQTRRRPPEKEKPRLQSQKDHLQSVEARLQRLEVTPKGPASSHHEKKIILTIIGDPQKRYGPLATPPFSHPSSCLPAPASLPPQSPGGTRTGRPPPLTSKMKPLYWDSTEIDPWTGQRYTWDSPNPNVTWDGIREPGDPGYVPPPATFTPANRKRATTMKHNSYYPTNTAAQILWLTNFFNKLRVHATALGLATGIVNAAVADARWLIYLLGSSHPAVKTWAKSITDYMREAQTGTGETVMILPTFTQPALPAEDTEAGLPAVAPVKPGALNRIFSLVQVIQESAAYTASIATDLGTIGSEDPAPDFNTLQPVIKAELRASSVFIAWGWDGRGDYLDMLQIQVDRGQGWTDLTYDTTPGYLDTAPHPATLTKWKYRAIYRVGDAQVGLWSAETSVVVGG